MPESQESMLAAFLAEVFSEDELRRWAHRTLGPEAYRDLPGKGTSLNEVAFQAALLVSKYGCDNEVLFESLLQERPGLTTRIRVMAEQWSASVTAPVPALILRPQRAVASQVSGERRVSGIQDRVLTGRDPMAELEFASIVLERSGSPWLLMPGRDDSSPFDMPCLHHLQLQSSTETSDLSLDVTVLNLASRPLTLSHVGVEVVELCTNFAHLEKDDSVLALTRRIPAAGKIEKEDAYAIGAQELFKLIRPHIIRVLKQGIRSADSSTGIVGGTAVSKAVSSGGEAAIIAIGETVWSQLAHPVYLSAGAPYRFDLIVGFQRYFPGNMILRLAARTQLGAHYSGPIETSIEL